MKTRVSLKYFVSYCRLVKILLDYDIMFYYRVANFKCNSRETLLSPCFFNTSQLRRVELLDLHPKSPEQ